MSKLPLSRSNGCWIERHPRHGWLRLRWRHNGRKCAAPTTELVDTPANRQRLEPLRTVVASLLARGTDPRPHLDALRATTATAAPSTKTAPAGLTVRSYYLQWIVEQTPPLVRPAQARDYRRHFEGYVLRLLGDVLLADLRASDIRGAQAELLTSGRPRHPGAKRPRRGTPSQHQPLSPKTVKNILGGSFRAMLRQARVDEVITRDVFAEHQWPRVMTPEPDPFTSAERTTILAWFAARTFRLRKTTASLSASMIHLPYYAYLMLLFTTGMRPSEASGLQWRDVDLAARRLFIRRSRHLWSYGDPKTASARRTVELAPRMVAVLRTLAPLRVQPTHPVFVNTRGEAIEPNSLLPHWYAAQRAHGIRVRGLYATKDTFVTTALQAGVKIAWLEAQTGVAYATLKRHYGKWMPVDDQDELSRFATVDPTLFGADLPLRGANRGGAKTPTGRKR